MKIEIISKTEIKVNGILFTPSEEKPKPKSIPNEEHPAWGDFLRLWDKYEKKGNKPQAFKNLIALTQNQRNEMYKKVQEYVKSTPDKAFRKGLEVYLNKKKEHWNDLIVQPEPTGYNKPAVSSTSFKKYVKPVGPKVKSNRTAKEIKSADYSNLSVDELLKQLKS